MKTINFENNEILPLTKEQHEPYENIKICYICEKMNGNTLRIKIIIKLKTTVIIHAINIIYNLKYNMPKEIPLVFCNRSNYDYHFIIKELPN